MWQEGHNQSELDSVDKGLAGINIWTLDETLGTEADLVAILALVLVPRQRLHVGSPFADKVNDIVLVKVRADQPRCPRHQRSKSFEIQLSLQ